MNNDQQNLIRSYSEDARLQELYNELIRIFPAIIIFVFLYLSQDSFLALIVYEIYIALMPIFYLKFLYPRSLKGYYSMLFLQNWKNQIIFGIIFSFLSFAISFSLFLWIFKTQPLYFMAFKFFIAEKEVIYIFIFIIMVFVNPILSEIYWRSLTLDSIKRPKRFRTCLYYGIFHGIVIYYFKNTIFGLFFSMISMIFGWLFTLFKEKIGIIVSILAHMGLNITYCLALILIIKEQRKFLS